MSPASATDDSVATAARGGQAFGIHIESSFPIPCLPPNAPNGAVPTVVDGVPTQTFESMWQGAEAERVIEYRLPNGRRLMTIDRDHERGYRIWASRFGRHLVSNDG